MTTPRPYATYTHKELLDAYRDPPTPAERIAIMAELDLRKREAEAQPKPKKFAPGWKGNDWGRRSAGEHLEGT